MIDDQFKLLFLQKDINVKQQAKHISHLLLVEK